MPPSPDQRFLVSPAERGLRLDRFLAEHLDGWSRSEIRDAISSGRVTVNGSTPSVVWFVKPGQDVRVRSAASAPLPGPEGIGIVYQDKALAVVSKPPGMVVHPSPGHAGHSLEELLLPILGGGSYRPQIVHRLDRETTGLVVLARSASSRFKLMKAFASRQVEKRYRVVVWGKVLWEECEVTVPLRESQRRSGRRVELLGEGEADPAAKEAHTRFRVIERGQGWAELAAWPLTGRTHQIRVHLTSLGCAVIGDTVYGRTAHLSALREHPWAVRLLPGEDQFLLHAEQLRLTHPQTGKALELSAPPPESYAAALTMLREKLPGAEKAV